jgi:hypothetical protein
MEIYDDAGWDRYVKTSDWLREGLLFDPGSLPMHTDITVGLCGFMTALAGPEGANLLRLRSFKLSYKPQDFPDWVQMGIFHHPTPMLEELMVEMQDHVRSTIIIHPIFVHPAPSLSRLSIHTSYPINDLISPGQADALYINLQWLDLNAFPSQELFRNLRYLRIQSCVNEFDQEDAFQDVLLPSLEDLALLSNF